jgi:uncharacterized protein (DUF427 family)
LRIFSKIDGYVSADPAAHHWAGVPQDLVEVQVVDVADQFHQVHVQFDGTVIAATHLQVGLTWL